jgi:hypothetical protein
MQTDNSKSGSASTKDKDGKIPQQTGGSTQSKKHGGAGDHQASSI